VSDIKFLALWALLSVECDCVLNNISVPNEDLRLFLIHVGCLQPVLADILPQCSSIVVWCATCSAFGQWLITCRCLTLIISCIS
jgi:hypothetical protein